MRCSKLAILALATAVARACADGQDHRHMRRSQPGATQSSAWPTRPLAWGDVNFLHTTDNHGWMIGHGKSSPPEPNYSGDFGDFYSFVTHMHAIAKEKDVDLLLVDSGDLHDGTGLSDGYPVGGGISIPDSNPSQFIKRIPYDILAIGNHELYRYNITLDMYSDFAPYWQGKYLSSNVNITVPDPSVPGNEISLPIGSRFRKFTTRKGRKVTAFGVLFNFAGNPVGTTVQKVADMVQETWFQDAIQEEPDFFLLVGHMPIVRDDWPLVFDAIRVVHKTTPVFIFGGHTHIRDCNQLDARSVSLESGRFMETIGWLSADITDIPKTQNLTFSRRYLDPNRNTYQYHTKTSNETFDTPGGVNMTNDIAALAASFNLSYKYGTAPHDYYLDRAPYPSPYSILTLFMDYVLPTVLTIGEPNRVAIPRQIVANAGSQRFDLYSGPFTKNDQLTVSPFTNEFLYLNLPWHIGKQVIGELNEQGPLKRDTHDFLIEDPHQYSLGSVEARFHNWKRAQWLLHIEDAETANLTLGYVTTDSCPGIGDDISHVPLPYYPTPIHVASPAPAVQDTDNVDLVFLDFILTNVITIVNALQTSRNYTVADTRPYSQYSTNEVFGVYAQVAWN